MRVSLSDILVFNLPKCPVIVVVFSQRRLKTETQRISAVPDFPGLLLSLI